MWRFLFLLLFPILLNAQNPFSVEPNPSEASALATANFFNSNAELINHTDSILTLKWKRVLIEVPEGWDTQVCLNSTCLASHVEEGTLELEPTYPISFSNTFYPNEIVGSGKVETKVWVQGDTTTTITQVYFGHALLTATEIIEEEKVQIYPNPMSDSFRLFVQQPYSRIEIYSAKGQLIHRFSKKEIYPVTQLSEGIYFLKIIDEQNIVLVVKYFIKN